MLTRPQTQPAAHETGGRMTAATLLISIASWPLFERPILRLFPCHP